MKQLTYIFLWCVVTARLCAYGPIIEDPSPRAFERFDTQSRVRVISPTMLVLHYTACSLDAARRVFTTDANSTVSAHYTIAEDGVTYRHVQEHRMARHAGVIGNSFWRGTNNLNPYSIGVEHVNLGYKEKPEQPSGLIVRGAEEEWYPFDARQIARSIALCREMLQRNHHIPARNIVAHSDIAPGRKPDPGPLFPWEQFAQAGIGAWPRDSGEYVLPCLDAALDNHEQQTWLTEHLHYWGYRLPGDNCPSTSIVRAFQMHFRPRLIDGNADAETAHQLERLLCEHVLQDGTQPCPCTAQQ